MFSLSSKWSWAFRNQVDAFFSLLNSNSSNQEQLTAAVRQVKLVESIFSKIIKT